MHNVIYLCLGTNNILLMHKIYHAFLLLAITLAFKSRSLHFPGIFIKKQTQWSNDKTIIVELGYRKMSWRATVWQINYVPQFFA